MYISSCITCTTCCDQRWKGCIWDQNECSQFQRGSEEDRTRKRHTPPLFFHDTPFLFTALWALSSNIFQSGRWLTFVSAFNTSYMVQSQVFHFRAMEGPHKLHCCVIFFSFDFWTFSILFHDLKTISVVCSVIMILKWLPENNNQHLVTSFGSGSLTASECMSYHI